nr:hypothetical protein [Tanacetum cinerariifolium]
AATGRRPAVVGRLGWVVGREESGGGSTVVAAGRVRESGIDERTDRETSNLFGFTGKIPPEKFSGGGRRRRVVAGRQEAAAGGGEWGEIPRVCVY